jgi:V8-like Glu-specific endopeptidase
LTRTGHSVILTAAQQPAQVGALFAGSIASGHHCTASVVDSPAGDLLVTAAHCLSSGASSHVFVPAYHDGKAPHGIWKISQVVEDAAWTSGRNPDHDVAFAVVEPLDGRSLESVVGGYGLDTGGSGETTVQITGYPTSTDRPISCTGTAKRFTDTQLTVYCTGYADGTSGSGWVEDYDPATGTGRLIGVIGGYQTGGDTEDVSYAALFGTDVRSLYEQAVAIS